MWSFGFDATTGATIWATVALVIFLGIAGYFGIHKTIAKLLDDRIKKIETDLAEAEALRAEAKALLDDYARRREEAEKEAEGIVTAAREEAFRLTAEAKASLEARVTRREKAVRIIGFIVFSPDGQMLAVLRSMSEVHLVDPATGRLFARLPAAAACVRARGGVEHPLCGCQ